MHAPIADLPPIPPEKPLASDCCEAGCERCVFDRYADALDQYERALAGWQACQVRPDA